MNTASSYFYTRIVLLIVLLGLLGFISPAQAQLDDFYEWPPYTNPPSYDFSKEVTNLPPPTKVLDDVKNVAGTYTDGWWCFRYGPNKNPLVTDASWVPMIARLNKDFSYITDVMAGPVIYVLKTVIIVRSTCLVPG